MELSKKLFEQYIMVASKQELEELVLLMTPHDGLSTVKNAIEKLIFMYEQ